MDLKTFLPKHLESLKFGPTQIMAAVAMTSILQSDFPDRVQAWIEAQQKRASHPGNTNDMRLQQFRDVAVQGCVVYRDKGTRGLLAEVPKLFEEQGFTVPSHDSPMDFLVMLVGIKAWVEDGPLT